MRDSWQKKVYLPYDTKNCVEKKHALRQNKSYATYSPQKSEFRLRKKICYHRVCCCLGDYVVRQCHLFPLYPWQDIWLIFAEMELDSTTMFVHGTNLMFIRSTE